MSISGRLSARAWALEVPAGHIQPGTLCMTTSSSGHNKKKNKCFDVIYYSGTEYNLLSEGKTLKNEHEKHFRVFKKCEESCRFTQN